MNRILITGSNSFIGRNFISLSRYSDTKSVSMKIVPPKDIDFIGFDVVLHLAAIVHQKKKISKEIYFAINKDLTIAVAKQAKKAGVKQFVFLSTLRVYGKFTPEINCWNEDSNCFPDDFYGLSKYEAELELKKLEDVNFTVSILRPPLVYGEGVPANMLSIIKLVERFPILPFKSVENKRSFVSTENLVIYIDQIIKLRASGTFIAADEKPLSTTELVLFISKYLNKKLFLIKTPKFIIKIGLYLIPQYVEKLYGSFLIDNKKTLDTLKIESLYSTDDSIKNMIIKYLESKKQKQ